MAHRDEFRKHYGKPDEGYTMEEAMLKKAKVDEAYGTSRPDAKWHPAEILPDTTKKCGYYLVIVQK